MHCRKKCCSELLERTGLPGANCYRVEDVTISVRSDKFRNEYIRGTVQVGLFGEKTTALGKTEVVWTCMQERWVYWEKDAEA